MKKKNSGLCFVVVLLSTVFLLQAKSNPVQDYTKFVDPYIGSSYHGHVFVGTSTPFGMVQVGPNNIHKGWDWCSGYHYSDSIVIGFSHTHLNGTGCTDLGDVLLMPVSGDVRTPRGNQDDISQGYASLYSHKNEVVRPDYYSLFLDRYQIQVELTSTDRVGFHRYRYPKGKPAHVILDLKEGNGNEAFDTYLKQVDDYTIEGYRFSHGWSPTHKVYFSLKSNQKIKNFGVYDDNQLQLGKEFRSKQTKGVLSFDQAGEVLLKVGISSVSCANAAKHIELETPDWNFEGIARKNKAKWNAQLSKVDLTTRDTAARKIFYTAFYHTMVAPTLYSDYNGEYRGHDDKTHKSTQPVYSTFSLWDTYRAAHPLMTLLHPERVDEMMNSMLDIFDQQGKLPIWPLLGGETNQMPGYSAVPVLADAYLKGFKGFDAERAFAAMKSSATNRHQIGVSYLLDKTYIPADKIHEATSYALEYAVDDWGIAAMARKMGKTADAETFAKRAAYYQNYFDSSVGFMRPKMDDGSWRTPYDPARSIHSVGDFCEGNGWQYTFFVPQDPYGLIRLFGGDEAFSKKLDAFFTNNDSMGDQASSDITGLIGQYAHGNEPSHHMTYLYSYAGKPWKTAEKVRYIMDEFYTDKKEGIIGNEDCGQMSAWYLLSAMGFYQVNPSDGLLVFGSPRFDKLRFKVGHQKTFTIRAINNSKDNIYIQRVRLNGKPYSKSYIRYSDVMAGGELIFDMGNKPSSFGVKPANRVPHQQ